MRGGGRGPEDEVDGCTPDEALVDGHVWGDVAERGKRRIGDGCKVGVCTDPEVFFAKQAMIDASGA